MPTCIAQVHDGSSLADDAKIDEPMDLQLVPRPVAETLSFTVCHATAVRRSESEREAERERERERER